MARTEDCRAADGKALLKYVTGDATSPHGDGVKIITHICNDSGGWGRGFVLAISKKWPQPEAAYRRSSHGLASTELVKVADDIFVLNMVAQHGYGSQWDPVPLRYDALELCLSDAQAFAKYHKASIHMPRIGCGLAGGKWDLVEKIVERQLTSFGIDVTVYDLP